MPSPKRSRGGNSLTRKVGTKDPKKRVVVVCEGAKTEPSYLKLINARTSSALVELLLLDEPATSPKQLVERACREKREAEGISRRTKDPNAKIDEIWCAFDVDEHPMLKEACQQAKDNGIAVAVSNPSIEVWFLLHFKDQQGHIHRHEALKQLRQHISKYNKHLIDLDDLLDKYAVARERASKLQAKHLRDGTKFPENNPSSDIWKLVESLGAAY